MQYNSGYKTGDTTGSNKACIVNGGSIVDSLYWLNIYAVEGFLDVDVACSANCLFWSEIHCKSDYGDLHYNSRCDIDESSRDRCQTDEAEQHCNNIYLATEPLTAAPTNDPTTSSLSPTLIPSYVNS